MSSKFAVGGSKYDGTDWGWDWGWVALSDLLSTNSASSTITSVAYRFCPLWSSQLRVWMLPTIQIEEPLLKYLLINSAVFLQAMQFMKSVFSRFVLRVTATVNVLTGVPVGVCFNSTSAVNLPPKITLLRFRFAIVVSPLISDYHVCCTLRVIPEEYLAEEYRSFTGAESPLLNPRFPALAELRA